MIQGKPLKIHKRSMTLIEVLVALTILSLAIFPLITPHNFMLLEQRKFIQKIEVDHFVNELYAHLTQKLYENRVDWSLITTSEKMSVADLAEEMGEKKRPPYEGTYYFEVHDVKPPSIESVYRVFLLDLFFVFKSKITEEELKYHYQIMVIQDRTEGELPSGVEEGEEGSSEV